MRFFCLCSFWGLAAAPLPDRLAPARAVQSNPLGNALVTPAARARVESTYAVRNAGLDNACSNLNWYRNSKIFVSYRSTTPVSDELACSLLFALSLRAVKRSGGTIRRDCRVQHIMHAPNRCSPTITIIEIRFKVDLRRQGFWVTETVFPTLPSHSCARWVLGGRPRLGGFMQKYLRACNCALNYTGNIDGNANNTPGYLEPQKWVVVIGRFTRSWGNDYER